MRPSTLIALIVLLISTPCGFALPQGKPDRVLFVGNSLTYVGNVPAVFSALAAANGHAVSSDMIVEAGATLSERVADGTVARALKEHEYTALVLQERGGDLICPFGPDACARSRQAIGTLAQLARRQGLTVVLLGTYQTLPVASRELSRQERSAASDADIAYIDVSERLQRLGKAFPALTWFDTDGMHPGKDLALLDAVLIYKQLFGAFPDVKPVAVKAPIYSSASGLTAALRAADAAPPKKDTPQEVAYAADTIEGLVGALSGD